MRISDWSSDVCSSDLPEAWTVEQRIDYLAEGQARFAQPVSHKLYENPEVRAEIRRIGFLNGCQLVKQARKDVLNAHFVQLKTGYTAAIRKTVDETMLKTTRFLSFNASQLMSTSFLIQPDAARSMASKVTTIPDDLP